MIDPTPEQIGQRVAYRARGPRPVEYGTITSFTPAYVFVRYGDGRTSAATRREDLDWAPSKEPTACD